MTIQELEKSDLGDVTNEFVTIRTADQLFGIPVKLIHDVYSPKAITEVPLANDEVDGVLNLRGRIVTAIDVRCCLGLTGRDKSKDVTD